MGDGDKAGSPVQPRNPTSRVQFRIDDQVFDVFSSPDGKAEDHPAGGSNGTHYHPTGSSPSSSSSSSSFYHPRHLVSVSAGLVIAHNERRALPNHMEQPQKQQKKDSSASGTVTGAKDVIRRGPGVRHHSPIMAPTTTSKGGAQRRRPSPPAGGVGVGVGVGSASAGASGTMVSATTSQSHSTLRFPSLGGSSPPTTDGFRMHASSSTNHNAEGNDNDEDDDEDDVDASETKSFSRLSLRSPTGKGGGDGGGVKRNARPLSSPPPQPSGLFVSDDDDDDDDDDRSEGGDMNGQDGKGRGLYLDDMAGTPFSGGNGEASGGGGGGGTPTLNGVNAPPPLLPSTSLSDRTAAAVAVRFPAFGRRSPSNSVGAATNHSVPVLPDVLSPPAAAPAGSPVNPHHCQVMLALRDAQIGNHPTHTLHSAGAPAVLYYRRSNSSSGGGGVADVSPSPNNSSTTSNGNVNGSRTSRTSSAVPSFLPSPQQSVRAVPSEALSDAGLAPLHVVHTSPPATWPSPTRDDLKPTLDTPTSTTTTTGDLLENPSASRLTRPLDPADRSATNAPNGSTGSSVGTMPVPLYAFPQDPALLTPSPPQPQSHSHSQQPPLPSDHVFPMDTFLPNGSTSVGGVPDGEGGGLLWWNAEGPHRMSGNNNNNNNNNTYHHNHHGSFTGPHVTSPSQPTPPDVGNSSHRSTASPLLFSEGVLLGSNSLTGGSQQHTGGSTTHPIQSTSMVGRGFSPSLSQAPCFTCFPSASTTGGGGVGGNGGGSFFFGNASTRTKGRTPEVTLHLSGTDRPSVSGGGGASSWLWEDPPQEGSAPQPHHPSPPFGEGQQQAFTRNHVAGMASANNNGRNSGSGSTTTTTTTTTTLGRSPSTSTRFSGLLGDPDVIPFRGIGSPVPPNHDDREHKQLQRRERGNAGNSTNNNNSTTANSAVYHSNISNRQNSTGSGGKDDINASQSRSQLRLPRAYLASLTAEPPRSILQKKASQKEKHQRHKGRLHGRRSGNTSSSHSHAPSTTTTTPSSSPGTTTTTTTTPAPVVRGGAEWIGMLQQGKDFTDYV